jgi:hypothetical protein
VLHGPRADGEPQRSDCGAVTTTASGHAERRAALALIEPQAGTPVTLGADKGYDSADFVTALRDKTVSPHVAQNASGRRSATLLPIIPEARVR